MLGRGPVDIGVPVGGEKPGTFLGPASAIGTTLSSLPVAMVRRDWGIWSAGAGLGVGLVPVMDPTEAGCCWSEPPVG